MAQPVRIVGHKASSRDAEGIQAQVDANENLQVNVNSALPTGTNTLGKVGLIDQFSWNADCTPNAELITCEKVRLVGSIFNGAVLDGNFWGNSVSTGTAAVASSELVLTSGTAADHYAKVYSIRRANWVTGTSNKFRTQMRVGSNDADVTIRFGVGWGATMPTITDGAYFKFVGATVSVNTMAATVEVPVASGSFNGTYTAPTLTNNNTYEILYTLGKVYFLINNVIIHTATFSTTHWTSGTTNFHAFADVVNTGDSSAIKYTFRMLNITRLGAIDTMPQYKYITGVTTAQILKYGGGKLHKLIVGTGVANKTINVFDDTAGSANLMMAILLPNNADPFSLDIGAPFFNGLTITPNDAGLKLTAVYE